MLSPLIKKLIFARQFFMMDGRIEVLGKKQVMMPAEVLLALQANTGCYEAVKENIQNSMEDYAKKIGATSSGMLKSLEEIFDTFGLGRMEVIDLKFDKKIALVRLYDSPLRGKGSKGNFPMLSGSLAGMFSFVFGKNVNAKIIKLAESGRYIEFQVNSDSKK